MKRSVLAMLVVTLLASFQFALAAEAPYRVARVLKHGPFADQKFRPLHLAWTPDGKYFISATGYMVDVWDAGSWERGWTWYSGHLNSVRGIAVSPDSRYLALALFFQEDEHGIRKRTNYIRILDPATGRMYAQLTLGEDEQVDALVWVENYRIAASVTGGIVKMWDFSESGHYGLQFDLHTMLVGHTTVWQNTQRDYTPALMVFGVLDLWSRDGKVILGGNGFIAVYERNTRAGGYNLKDILLADIEYYAYVADVVVSRVFPDTIIAREGNYGVVFRISEQKREPAIFLEESTALSIAERADGAVIAATGDGKILVATSSGRAEKVYDYYADSEHQPTSRLANLGEVNRIAPHPTNPDIVAYAPGGYEIRILER